jgi:hypothetical protein
MIGKDIVKHFPELFTDADGSALHFCEKKVDCLELVQQLHPNGTSNMRSPHVAIA